MDAPEWMNTSFPNFNDTEFEGAAGASYGGELKFSARGRAVHNRFLPEKLVRDLPTDLPQRTRNCKKPEGWGI